MLSTLIKRSKMTKKNWQDVESSKDVLCNILSRLPARDLLRYRTVSSHWRSVIRSPELAKNQLVFSKDNPIFIALPYISDEIDIYLIDADGSVLDGINMPGCENLTLFRINSVGNGLVCFTNCPIIPPLGSNLSDTYDPVELDIRIVNPCTREAILLPRGTPSDCDVEVGVAFGPEIANYKVYRIFTPMLDIESEDVITECEVFTPKTKAWVGIGRVPGTPVFLNSVFVDNKVHWFLRDEERLGSMPSAVLLVDIDDDFWVIETPADLSEADRVFLTELDSRLCVVGIFYTDMVMHVWLLEYRDMGYFWEDFHCANIFYSSNYVTEAVSGRKDEFFVITETHCFLYNIRNRRWKEIDYSDCFYLNSPSVFPFTASLAPCDGVMGPDF